MKYISALLSHLHPMRMLLSVLLSTVLFLASGCTAEVAKGNTPKETVQISASKGSSLNKGTVQLDEIEQKANEAINAPAASLETIIERSKDSLNEVQGDAADSSKMNHSKAPKGSTNKMKKS